MSSTLSSSTRLAQGSVRSFAQSKLGRATVIVSATAFIAVCAHISVPLPFTPVPLTMQDLAVLLVGLALGPVDGFAALALYLAEGAAGMPVFNPSGLGGVAQLMGPTGGFLMAYPLVAAVAGWGARSIHMKSLFARSAVACVMGSVILFALGAAWMSSSLHLSTENVLRMGVYPFVPGNLFKVAAASGIYSSLNRWLKN